MNSIELRNIQVTDTGEGIRFSYDLWLDGVNAGGSTTEWHSSQYDEIGFSISESDLIKMLILIGRNNNRTISDFGVFINNKNIKIDFDSLNFLTIT